MTTLVTIPGCTALHLPSPTSSPLPLSTGDLNLVLIPANPPSHPSATLTLSVGSSSFPLLPISPVQRVKAVQEHPTYQFTPVPVDGSAAVGAVRIQMKDSKSQGEWDATEALCAKLEQELRSHGIWDEKILFVNDEHETSGAPVKGWGETVAETVLGGATALASKLNNYTNAHIPAHAPNPISPNPKIAGGAAAVRNQTAALADRADQGAQVVGEKIHQAGKSLGEKLPDSIAKKSQPVPDHEKSDLQKMAESTWSEVTAAAKGIAEGAVTVGKALSENAHKAVEHNFGKQADQVAQDVGQTGSNLASAAFSAGKATSVVMQGSNAASGAASTASRNA